MDSFSEIGKGVLGTLGFTQSPEGAFYSLVIMFLISYIPIEFFFAKYESEHESSWKEMNLVTKLLLCTVTGGLIFSATLIVYVVIAPILSIKIESLSVFYLSILSGAIIFSIFKLSENKKIKRKKTIKPFEKMTSSALLFFLGAIVVIGVILFIKSRQIGNLLLLVLAMLLFYSDTKSFQKNKGKIIKSRTYKKVNAFLKKQYNKLKKLLSGLKK